mmetsp:Transcript_52581/g.64411  ORF Transcript_52581/g.64411 Transcript_52581/m.64411 type:complete len:216 (-) Transcript_52581:47-694(-)
MRKLRAQQGALLEAVSAKHLLVGQAAALTGGTHAARLGGLGIAGHGVSTTETHVEPAVAEGGFGRAAGAIGHGTAGPSRRAAGMRSAAQNGALLVAKATKAFLIVDTWVTALVGLLRRQGGLRGVVRHRLHRRRGRGRRGRGSHRGRHRSHRGGCGAGHLGRIILQHVGNAFQLLLLIRVQRSLGCLLHEILCHLLHLIRFGARRLCGRRSHALH